MDRQIIKLPFMGFYYTPFSAEIDRCEEQEIERMADETGLDGKEIGDKFWRHANYMDAYQAVARKYVEFFNDFVKEEKGLDLQLEFESMSSPREYNFETDRIFCWCPETAVKALLDQTNQGDLAERIKENHTSRSGFISSYSNDVLEWLEKPTDEWDHNEVATLLEAFLLDIEDWQFRIFERMAEGAAGVFYTAFQNCVDWPALEAEIEEMKNANE